MQDHLQNKVHNIPGMEQYESDDESQHKSNDGSYQSELQDNLLSEIEFTNGLTIVNDFANIPKFTLYKLPAQCGKTFTAITKIDKELDNDSVLGRSIHLVYTMNTHLNNAQFAKRILENIEAKYGIGSIITFSSTHKGSKYAHINNILELYNYCRKVSTTPRVIIMCTNKSRRCNGVEFLKELEDGEFGHITRAYIYYDEIHKYIDEGKIDNLRSQIERISLFNIVHSITGLSATPENLYKERGRWSKIFIQSNNISYDNYIGCDDMEYIKIDDYFETPYIQPRSLTLCDTHTIGFVEHVLEHYPDILKNNTRTFIPAHIQCAGHYAMRNLIFKINPQAIVVLINGDEKTIKYKNSLGEFMTIPLISTNEEVCETIYRLVCSEKIGDRPLVITGYICVSMGQTLTYKKSGSFTSAIFSHMGLSNDDIYQLFGRLAGRMRDWETYVRTKVYCPTLIKNRVSIMERCAKKDVPIGGGGGSFVSRNEYREPMYEMEGGLSEELENVSNKKKKKSNDSTPKTTKQPQERVPVVIGGFTGLEPIFNFPNGDKNKDKKIDCLLSIIRDDPKYEKLLGFITHPDVTCSQATKPLADNSYKKHISPLVNNAFTNTPYSIDFTQEQKVKNTWNLYIDNREHRVCILLWVVDETLY